MNTDTAEWHFYLDEQVAYLRELSMKLGALAGGATRHVDNLENFKNLSENEERKYCQAALQIEYQNEILAEVIQDLQETLKAN